MDGRGSVRSAVLAHWVLMRSAIPLFPIETLPEALIFDHHCSRSESRWLRASISVSMKGSCSRTRLKRGMSRTSASTGEILLIGSPLGLGKAKFLTFDPFLSSDSRWLTSPTGPGPLGCDVKLFAFKTQLPGRLVGSAGSVQWGRWHLNLAR